MGMAVWTRLQEDTINETNNQRILKQAIEILTKPEESPDNVRTSLFFKLLYNLADCCLDRGVSINAQDTESGMTCAHFAAVEARLRFFSVAFLSNGSSVSRARCMM